MSAGDSLTLGDGGRVRIAPGGAALICADAFGIARWTVTPLDAGDAFIEIAIDDGAIRASSWRGVIYVIDPMTGVILSATFAK